MGGRGNTGSRNTAKQDLGRESKDEFKLGDEFLLETGFGVVSNMTIIDIDGRLVQLRPSDLVTDEAFEGGGDDSKDMYVGVEYIKANQLQNTENKTPMESKTVEYAGKTFTGADLKKDYEETKAKFEQLTKELQSPKFKGKSKVSSEQKDLMRKLRYAQNHLYLLSDLRKQLK